VLIQTQFRLLWEVFNHAVVYCAKNLQKYPLLSRVIYSFIQSSQLQQYEVNEIAQFKNISKRIQTQILSIDSLMYGCYSPARLVYWHCVELQLREVQIIFAP